MKIEDTALRAIQDRAAEVFRAYGVELHQKGGSLIGRCPFHQDHKPSFAVRLDGPKSGQWTCFACGAKGRDIFSFVAQMEGLNTDSDFPQVVRKAAATCGLSYLIGNEQSEPTTRLHQPAPTAPRHKEPPRYFNAEAEAMAAEVEETNLFRYLCRLWDAAKVRKVMEAYKVGRGHYISRPRSKGNDTDEWCMNPQPLCIQGTTVATSFPSIDDAGNVHAVKIIPYPATDHHRIKEAQPDKATLYWFKPEQNPGAYFGTHLLPLHPDKPVAVVESEKSAIIGSLFAPEYVWLATAGATNLNAKHPGLKALEGRILHLFPDADKLKEWRSAADDLRAAGFSVHFRNEVMGRYPPECKLDIADLMIKEKEYEKEWE